MLILKKILDFVCRNPLFTFIGTVTLIQITPIKINPWNWLVKKIKSLLFGSLEKEILDLKKDVLDEKINNKRWNVLDFSNSCRQGRRHTKEEWEHCIAELAWYEDYCERHKVNNGVMTECAKYLRKNYQDHLEKNDFL